MSFIKATDFPIPGESSVVTDFEFDPANGIVKMYEEGFRCPLLIVNLTAGQVIFNPSKPALSGKQEGNRLDLVLDVSTMDSSDNLLIIVAVNRHNTRELQLQAIIDQLKLTNELLMGILEQ